jgi:hypothetical protein
MSTRAKRWLPLVLALLFASLALPAQAAGAWVTVGSAGFSAGQADTIRLALDNDGTPYVAYRDVSDMGNYQARVMKYVGGAWVTVGSEGFTTDSLLANHPGAVSLALASDGTPYLAYRDAGNSGKATVRRYDGSAWVTVGSAGFTTGEADNLSLALDGNGSPYLAYRDGAHGNEATVVRYNDSAWEIVGSAGFSAGEADNLSLALSSGGTPWVAYSDVFWGSKVMVSHYVGGIWQNAGTSLFGPGDTVTLALDDNDTPYVAYRDASSPFTSLAIVKRYNDSYWASVGSAVSVSGDYPSLALDGNGTPFVAYRDRTYPVSSFDRVARFDGSLWKEVGLSYFSDDQAEDLSLAVAGDGTPYVAFRDLANGYKVTVMKCDATPPTIGFSVLSGPQATSGDSTYVTSATTLRVSVTDANVVGAWGITVTAPDTSQSNTSLPFGNYDLTLNSGDGSYTLAVFATDGAGNDAWGDQIYIVDNTPPDTGISSGPPALTNSSTASFSFTSSETGSTFACSLDGAAFSACTNPQGYYTLADGSHTLQVQASDALGNTDASPASYSWTVDLIAPETTITSKPSGLTTDTSASLSFTSSETGSTFQCGLDNATYAACTSPQTYSGLAQGSHTFSVIATDAAGNSDASPATATWTIKQAYTFIGFLPPIDNPPTVNIGRAGRTYPVKWQLTDATGAYVGTLSAVGSISVRGVMCGQYNGDPADPLEAETSGATSLRYDSTANQYIYNWKTPLVLGCYTLVLTLDSGQVQTAYFELKK